MVLAVNNQSSNHAGGTHWCVTLHAAVLLSMCLLFGNRDDKIMIVPLLILGGMCVLGPIISVSVLWSH